MPALRSIIAWMVLCSSSPAFADVTVADAWVRGMVAGQTVTGAFMTLTSTEPASLVAASSPVAGKTELHRMVMDHEVMRMRPVKAITLPAMRAVELGSGGYHLMLMAVKQPLMPGATVPLTLTFKAADGRRFLQAVQAEVRPLAQP